jgi:cell division protein FtsW
MGSHHLVSISVALMGLGILMVYSAESPAVQQRSGHIYSSTSARQMIHSTAAVMLMLAASRLPYRRLGMRDRFWTSAAPWLLISALILLILVLIPSIGQQIKGARRWFRLQVGPFGFSLQPSEIAKFAIVIFLAALLSSRRFDIRRFWRGLLPTAAVIGIMCGLIGKEDLGTMVLVGAVVGGMLLAGGAKIWHLILLAIPALAGVVALVFAAPYRVNRLVGFLNIFDDADGVGYHPIQSLVTLSSGGIWGRGLGNGLQKHGYLPEAKTDFVFGVICEELGIAGGLMVIGLFAAWLWQAMAIIRRTPDDHGRLLALGISLMIGLQAVINIAVVTVSAPTKGISLPFISAGGSGVLAAGAATGLLAGVGRRRKVIEDPDWLDPLESGQDGGAYSLQTAGHT